MLAKCSSTCLLQRKLTSLPFLSLETVASDEEAVEDEAAEELPAAKKRRAVSRSEDDTGEPVS